MADEILPQLRRARLTANYDIIGRSDDEINEAFNSDPKVLSVEELLYAATLTNDNARKEAIFNKTTQLYPNDFRAYNNWVNWHSLPVMLLKQKLLQTSCF